MFGDRHGQIRLTGRKGSIIGGKVQAIRGLIATSLGNDAEKRTEIFVGAGIDVYSRLRVMEKKIEMTREELAKIEEGLEKFEILSKERGVSYTNDPRRTSLLRIKIKDSAMLASDEEEVRKLPYSRREFQRRMCLGDPGDLSRRDHQYGRVEACLEKYGNRSGILQITGQDRNKTVQCCCRIAEVSASKIA